MSEPTACPECDAPVPPATRRPRKYCSKRCSDRAAQRAHRERVPRTRTPEVFTKTCAWCDKAYTTSRRPGRYCSNHCASYGNGQAVLASDLTWRLCKHCDHWYPHGQCPLRDTHPRKAPPDLSPRLCHSCGTPFAPSRPSGHLAIYCSPRCNRREVSARRRARTRRDQWRPDRNQGRIRRHAIYERDRWKCQLCGRKVNPDLTVPHPMAATLDHIVPVSLGGAHEEANLQLAHFGCNSRKRNKVNGQGEQLRLAV
jgi:5-methylcytosine-specific restriction endonuclease McrA